MSRYLLPLVNRDNYRFFISNSDFSGNNPVCPIWYWKVVNANPFCQIDHAFYKNPSGQTSVLADKNNPFGE
jgi:hypothetical protein